MIEIENKQKFEQTWDEDEFEGFEGINAKNALEYEKMQKTILQNRRKRSVFHRQQNYYYEIVGIVLFFLFAINIYIGKLRNEHLALEWAQKYVTEDSIFSRNFSLIGPGDCKEGEVLF